jgi:hypothetical protein
MRLLFDEAEQNVAENGNSCDHVHYAEGHQNEVHFVSVLFKFFFVVVLVCGKTLGEQAIENLFLLCIRHYKIFYLMK